MTCQITSAGPGTWGQPVTITGLFAAATLSPNGPIDVKVELLSSGGASALAVKAAYPAGIVAQLPAEPTSGPHRVRVTTATGSCESAIQIVGVPAGLQGLVAVFNEFAEAGTEVELRVLGSVTRERSVVNDHRLGGRGMRDTVIAEPELNEVSPRLDGLFLSDGAGDLVEGVDFISRIVDLDPLTAKVLLAPYVTDYVPEEGMAGPFQRGPRFVTAQIPVGGDLLPVGFATKPLMLPRMAVFSRHTRLNFAEEDPVGAALVLTPALSELGTVDALKDAIAKTNDVISALNELKAFLGWAPGIGDLFAAVADAPLLAVRNDEVPNLDEVWFEQHETLWIDGLDKDLTGEDMFSSMAYIGAGGGVAMYNKRHFDPDDGEENWRNMSVGLTRAGCVIIDDLRHAGTVRTDSGPRTPEEVANGTGPWQIRMHDPNSDGFDDILGSVKLLETLPE